jgi:hypothetical protein
MFDIGHDQAAGLRGEPPRAGAALMPVACPAQPARAYELLCTLAAHLTALGREAVIVDGSAPEASTRRAGHDGSHLGLLHALQDASISGLGRAPEGAEWLVMPAAHGLQSLQQTARAAGAGVALARLLSPFSPDALVILFAPAQALGGLFAGLNARALVPVLPQAQASIDAYGALKLLHGAGLSPVLAPLSPGFEPESVPLQQVVDTVADCAQRHLGLQVPTWPVHTWGLRVQESALTRHSRHDTHIPQRGTRSAAQGEHHAVAAQPFWS